MFNRSFYRSLNGSLHCFFRHRLLLCSFFLRKHLLEFSKFFRRQISEFFFQFTLLLNSFLFLLCFGKTNQHRI
ncbi:MAG: hypothetical protein II661_06825, partial [Bacteroidales bacterium]|nr:hypothetical protein [Bacteroidales bacterium]